MSSASALFCVVLVTAPSEDVAARIATDLVDTGLVACCNIVPGVRSIYKWEGKVHDDHEVLMLCKTRRELFDDVAGRVKVLHPYDVPEVVMLPIEHTLEAYGKWLGSTTEFNKRWGDIKTE
eukprot:TRINITY_DN7426_c0_g1_i1.p2 TRINITY_DN7426_c0_g1~~TRINITY_DN7426_c0_g1_i1.p2  ORF type:complete len:121 (+),score=37.24 TRINITY_DN7426_c0_g1_i1:87-449(+)